MKNILLIVAALGILGAITAGCSQPAADTGTTSGTPAPETPKDDTE